MAYNFKNILLVQTGFIGDVILSTPVIDALCEHFPDANVSLLTTPVASQLFQADDRLNEVLTFDKRKSQSGIQGIKEMASTLKLKSFDAVFSLHKSYRTAILLKLSGIQERFGFSEAKWSCLYSKTSPRSQYSHDVLRNLAVFDSLGFKMRDRVMKLKVPEAKTIRAQSLVKSLPQEKTAVLAPASVWETKRWTASGFHDLAAMLIRAEFNVIFIGGPGDSEYVQEVAGDLLELETVRNEAGNLDLLDSAALIKESNVVVCNDSAPLHLASATHTPVVALFCATTPAMGYGPWMTPHEIVEVQGLTCRPCGRHGGNICPVGSYACRKLIPATNVFNAVERLVSTSENCETMA